MISRRHEPPLPPPPAGHRRAGNIAALLRADTNVFGEDFPATEENLTALLAEFRSHPGCYHAESDSFSTERIADWMIRNLADFRRGRDELDEEIQRLREERDEAMVALRIGKDSADVILREARVKIASLEAELEEANRILSRLQQV